MVARQPCSSGHYGELYSVRRVLSAYYNNSLRAVLGKLPYVFLALFCSAANCVDYLCFWESLFFFFLDFAVVVRKNCRLRQHAYIALDIFKLVDVFARFYHKSAPACVPEKPDYLRVVWVADYDDCVAFI